MFKLFTSVQDVPFHSSVSFLTLGVPYPPAIIFAVCKPKPPKEFLAVLIDVPLAHAPGVIVLIERLYFSVAAVVGGVPPKESVAFEVLDAFADAC